MKKFKITESRGVFWVRMKMFLLGYSYIDEDPDIRMFYPSRRKAEKAIKNYCEINKIVKYSIILDLE
jgi:hypothetical protein